MPQPSAPRGIPATTPRSLTPCLIVSLLGMLAVVLIVVGLMIAKPNAPTDVEETPTEEMPETPSEAETEKGPFYMTLMTHMEGNFRDDVDEALFNRHLAQLTWGMDLFDEYDAKITVETEQSFAKANTRWGRNFLKEIVDRGHGVGTHADFGAELVPKDVPFYIRAFKENKALVDDLVGAENNKGISGGTGAYDWVTAMARAGFAYADGIVGFGYLAMPLSERPDGWTDEYIRSSMYHESIPLEFADRIVMYDLKDADDLTPDEDGILTISGGDLGELASLEEGRENCHPSCELTNADIDVILRAVEQARDLQQPGQTIKLNVHMPLTLYNEDNEDVLRYFLEQMQTYVDDGVLTWATQLEAYEGYEAFSRD